MGSFIFIQLAGSGDVFKWNPHMAKLVLMLLAKTDYSVYISYTSQHSGLAHKLRQHITENYGATDRVVYSAPKRSFCTNVEIARQAAVVIGPETGLMVALSHEEDVRKVLLVSHSAVSNFADWKNTTFLVGKVPCSPCHRMHASFQYCNKDEATGAAKCQAVISAVKMFETVTATYATGNCKPVWDNRASTASDLTEEDVRKFLVVAPSEDAVAMAENIGAVSIPVYEGDTPDTLRNKLDIEIIEAERPE